MELTLEQLKQETCQSYGGNNCVLHQCMFGCVLNDAKKRALKAQGKSDKEIEQEMYNTKRN